jgi:hypothetical protein
MSTLSYLEWFKQHLEHPQGIEGGRAETSEELMSASYIPTSAATAQNSKSDTSTADDATGYDPELIDATPDRVSSEQAPRLFDEQDNSCF